MIDNHSSLKFKIAGIKNNLRTASEVPEVIYRYFKTRADRDNFLRGNVWFAGMNFLRFFQDIPDIFEYRNAIGLTLYEYSLSCSLSILNGNPTIKIVNPKEFVQEIINSMQDFNLSHSVLWIGQEEINEYKKNYKDRYGIKKLHSLMREYRLFGENYPVQGIEAITFYMQGAGGRYGYVDKIIDPNYQGNSVEIGGNSLLINDEFQEDEFRIFINSGDFIEHSGKSLQNWVHHLKIQCPNINKYCECIN